MSDCDVINAFVVYLQRNGYPELQIERWPDKENRNSIDIDAIAGIFAIEHTSIDTFPNQRRDSAWFKQVVGGLAQELPSKPPYRLRIAIKNKAITKGQNWVEIRKVLKNWIIEEVPRLKDGRRVFSDIPGLPFRLHVTKSSDRPPGVFISRFKPIDETFSNIFRDQFCRKVKKLARYQGIGKTTVLLIENDDIALMNDEKMLDAVRKIYPVGLPPGVDQIWYADTSIFSDIKFENFTSNINGISME